MILDYSQIVQLVEKNPEVRVSEQNVEAARIKAGSIARIFIPEVSLYGQSENHELQKVGKEPSAGVIATMNLFNGFRDQEEKKIEELHLESSRVEQKIVKNEKAFAAKKLFLDSLRIQQNLNILGQYEQINRNNRNLILRKVSSGLSPRSEEFIFRKIELELKEQKIKDETALKLNFTELRSLLALSPHEPIELKGTLDIAQYNYEPIKKSLDLTLAETVKARMENEEKLASLWRMPKLNLYAEKSFTNHVSGEFLEENDPKEIFGLRLTIPLISEKNFDSIEAQTKKIEQRSALIRYEGQVRERAANDEKIQLQIDHLKNMVEFSKHKVSLSKEIMSKTFEEFRVGLKEADDLNEATADYIESQRDMLEHQMEYILTVEEALVNRAD